MSSAYQKAPKSRQKNPTLMNFGPVLWLLSEVSFVIDRHRGRIAEITLMPAEAFVPQPPVSPWDRQVTQAMREGASTPSTSGMLGHI